jgi:hypothetical protein
MGCGLYQNSNMPGQPELSVILGQSVCPVCAVCVLELSNRVGEKLGTPKTSQTITKETHQSRALPGRMRMSLKQPHWLQPYRPHLLRRLGCGDQGLRPA